MCIFHRDINILLHTLPVWGIQTVDTLATKVSGEDLALQQYLCIPVVWQSRRKPSLSPSLHCSTWVLRQAEGLSVHHYLCPLITTHCQNMTQSEKQQDNTLYTVYLTWELKQKVIHISLCTSFWWVKCSSVSFRNNYLTKDFKTPS